MAEPQKLTVPNPTSSNATYRAAPGNQIPNTNLGNGVTITITTPPLPWT